MPEYAEVRASAYTIERWWQAISPSLGTAKLHLNTLWADPTKAEHVQAQKDIKGMDAATSVPEDLLRVSQELVYRLGPSSVIRRGTNSVQQLVYPQDEDGEPFTPENLRRMHFQSVRATPRTVVIDLGPMTLQVSSSRTSTTPHVSSRLNNVQIHLHTHTVSQIFTRAQWDDEICLVTASVSTAVHVSDSVVGGRELQYLGAEVPSGLISRLWQLRGSIFEPGQYILGVLSLHDDLIHVFRNSTSLTSAILDSVRSRAPTEARRRLPGLEWISSRNGCTSHQGSEAQFSTSVARHRMDP